MAENETKLAETAQTDTASKAKADKKSDTPAPKKKDKVKLSERLKKFWRDYKSEFKKIVWPSKEDTTRNTVVVVVSIVIVGVVVSVLDFLFSQGLTLLSHL